jgi:hypothetical protein
MKKIYLIQHNLSNNSIIELRIKSLGSWVKYFSENWIVETELSSKEIYQKLSVGFEQDSFMIIQLDNNNYYGRMNTTLWDYLKPRRKK